MKKALSLCFLVLGSYISQAQIYGPYIGGSLFGYKSNLFNSDDLRADSFQTYKITPGFSGSFDFGYLKENGVSINSGLEIGSSNQNYAGGDSSFGRKFTASSKLTHVKIPLTFGKQRMDGEHKIVLIYSAGFYYSYNAGYKDKFQVDYLDTINYDYTINTSKLFQTISLDGKDSIVNSYALSRRPYTRHGFGAIANLGISWRIKEKLDLTILAKSEFQINNAEITNQIIFSNTKNTAGNPILPESKYAFGNYAKYMSNNLNHNRAGTHPFNLGISIGLRYYIFEF